MPILQGACHCGNVSVSFETELEPEAIELRLDGCSFCRKHGATAVTDPKGRLALHVKNADAVLRYRFGLRTADFLVCAVCGVYVAAVQTEGDSSCATLNANVLDDRARFVRAAVPVDYDGETAEERRARCRKRWTPATFGGISTAGPTQS